VALERSELKLQATRAEYAGDVRDLYARGPLALELLLAAGDIHKLAVATGVAGGVLGRDLKALSSVGLATGTAQARVAELGATQADTLALRERLAGQEAAIGGCWPSGRPCWPPPGRGQGPGPGRPHAADRLRRGDPPRRDQDVTGQG
jgi:hypothetical protein